MKRSHAVLFVVMALARAEGTRENKAIGNSGGHCAVNARFLFLIDVSGSTIEHKDEYFKFVDKALDYLYGVSEKSAEAGDVDVAIALFGICQVPPSESKRNKKCLDIKSNTKDYIIQRPFGGNWQSLKEEKTKFQALYESNVDGFTPSDAALNLAREMFKNETTDKVATQNMVAILLTDGAPSDYDHKRQKYEGFEFSSRKMKAAADRLKNDGFKLFTIYVENEKEHYRGMSAELMQNSSSPNMSFTIGHFSDISAFDDAFSAIAEEVCSFASVVPRVIPDYPIGTVAPMGSRPTEQSDKKEYDGGTRIMIGVISAAFPAAALAAAIAGGIMMRRRWLKVGQADMVLETRDRGTLVNIGK